MPDIFNALPGIEVPVGEINKRLAQMWTDSAAEGRPALAAEDAKATQVNFVLHFGLNTTPEDAARQFQVVVELCRRYPGRIVVLCPRRDDVPAPEIRAKIYGECFLGKSRSDKRCVEFVTLSYSRSARPFLENQVSICLSTDLPLYYWAHRFSQSSRLADYRYLLSRARRVLIDSAISPPDALTYAWPNPAAIRDLVVCRLLPVRQTIGQFLGVYPPSVLAAGLQAVTVSYAEPLAAEARVLLGWLSERLAACGVRNDAIRRTAQPLAPEATGSLSLRFEYADPAHGFRWSGDLGTGRALFEADFETGRTKLPAAVTLLTPASALSEAMFF